MTQSLFVPVNGRRPHRVVWLGLALMCAGTPLWSQAEPSSLTDQSAAWRAATEAVGRFPRGHADVLKWESTQPDLAANHRPALEPLPPPHRLLQQGLSGRLELWVKPNDPPQVRQHKQQALAAWSRNLLQQWWQLAAAAEDVRLTADALESARLGAELGQRMAQVGNWSQARQLTQRQHRQAAEQAHRQALQAWRELQMALWAQVGPLQQSAVADAPPDWRRSPAMPPASEWDEAIRRLALRPDWQTSEALFQRAWAAWPDHARVQAERELSQQLDRQPTPADSREPRVWTEPPQLERGTQLATTAAEHALHAQAEWQALRNRLTSQTRLAWDRLESTHSTLKHALEHTLPAAQAVEEETQKRVNGMLASTWDLLAAQRARVETERALIRAQRDWQAALLDWQAVMAGADPALPALSNPASTPANAQPGH